MTATIKFSLVLVLCFLGMKVIAQQSEPPEFLSSKLTFVWETKNVLNIPESVFFDADHQCLYVSNINGSPSDHDGNGFLSKLNLAGEIVHPKWVEGLDAPKGIAKLGNSLFVSNINQLIAIDISKQKIIKKYAANQAKFLNDVAADPKNGIVYVSDMAQNCIYRLQNDKLEKWLENDRLDHVNGLFYRNGSLFAGVKNEILQIDPNTKQLKSIVQNTGSIDGLIGLGEKDWIISDWKGNIHLIESGKKTKILSTANQHINAADLGFIPDKNLILVPTFANNRIVAYRINKN